MVKYSPSPWQHRIVITTLTVYIMAILILTQRKPFVLYICTDENKFAFIYNIRMAAFCVCFTFFFTSYQYVYWGMTSHPCSDVCSQRLTRTSPGLPLQYTLTGGRKQARTDRGVWWTLEGRVEQQAGSTYLSVVLEQISIQSHRPNNAAIEC